MNHGAPDPRSLGAELSGHVKGQVLISASLAPYTTFRVGGPADLLLVAESEEDLIAAAKVVAGRLPVAIVGRGSNLLVADDGFRGLAVTLGRFFRAHRIDGETIRSGGAVYLPALARLTPRAGLTGFEFAAEIPATFGGAVRMNAGAHGRSMSDVLQWARVIDLANGAARRLHVADLGYRYRHSVLAPQEIVVEGEIRLERGSPEAVASEIATHLRWRRENQPPGRSAGSVFKNPPGDSAGRLLDAAGVKGLRIGGAHVSDVHANFIVADKGATASDVWRLMEQAATVVRDRLGVSLEREVRLLGSFQENSTST